MAIMVAGVVFCCSKEDSSHIAVEDPDRQEDIQARDVPEETETEEASEAEIYVYVCGAVKNPGVYCLPADARIFEAVDAAGGYTADAVPETLNLAAPMLDGQKVFVPDLNSTVHTADGTDPDGFAAEGQAGNGLVSLNRATLQELMTLPGIGEVKGQAIIHYRQEHAFETIEDVMKVPGIKENAFQKIRDLITVF